MGEGGASAWDDSFVDGKGGGGGITQLKHLPSLQALHIVLKHLEEIAPSKSNDDDLPLWLIAIDDDTYVNPITLLSLLSGVDASSSVMYGDKWVRGVGRDEGSEGRGQARGVSG